ncbi:ATP-binding protein [Candidatus Venteria ishoeyi]|uniref:ATP-binding protein n=1 Tax=Candidatus Venteria ishoeyi TaxID=1899563 RepID=UPI00387E6D0B
MKLAPNSDRMKLKLFPKLLFAFMLIAMLLILGMAASVHWTFKTGLQRYLHHQEVAQLEQLVPVLGNIYQTYGGWELLRHKHFLIMRTLRWSLKPPTDKTAQESRKIAADSLPQKIRELTDRRHRPHRRHRRGRRSHPLFPLLPRLWILDPQKQVVMTPEHKFSQGSSTPNAIVLENLHPVKSEGEIIAWLGISPHQRVEDEFVQAFRAQQTQNYYIIAALALLLSALAAWVLVRQLLTPVQHITQGAHRLSSGDYQTRVQVHSQDELGQLATDFNHLAQALARNEQMRRQWVADISHELRTPLAVLRGEIEAMQDGIRPLSAAHLLSLHKETLSLGKLVDDLYDLTLSDLGALDYRKEITDVNEILQQSLESFAARFQSKNIQVTNHVMANMPVFADRQRLQQLFTNLLENSVRYTDAGGELNISLQTATEQFTLIFNDSAPAVPEAAMPKLFERLYRVDQSRSRALGGAGLGLAICRNIVTAHAGEISAQASPLGGLGICLRLPKAKDNK